MEQGPNIFYERSGAEGLPRSPQSPERLLPPAEQSKSKDESLSTSKNFEELVHAALAEELKYERDPAMRDEASKRADEILAEFAEAKQMNGDNNSASKSDKSDELTPGLAKQLGINQSKASKKPDKPVYPGASLNSGLADLVMALVIAVLLIIIILLLIF